MKNFILKNRSLAENDPCNLLNRGCKKLDVYFKENGREAFVTMVWNVLDAAE